MYSDGKQLSKPRNLIKASEALGVRSHVFKGASSPLCPAPLVDGGHSMSLINRPSSATARAYVARLAREVHATLDRKRGVTSKQIEAVGAIVADLLFAASEEGGGYAFRSTGSDAFSDLPVGKKAFVDAMNGLEALGYVVRRKGYHKLGMIARNHASRFTPTETFLRLAASVGIFPADWHAHFQVHRRRKALGKPVVLKASNKKRFHTYGEKVPGEVMRLDKSHPTVVRSSRMINDINALIVSHRLENCPLYALRRVFNNGDLSGHNYTHGGRIYGLGKSYQNIRKADRRHIRINGEPIVELDIRCCQPTILAALKGEPLESGFSPMMAPITIVTFSSCLSRKP